MEIACMSKNSVHLPSCLRKLATRTQEQRHQHGSHPDGPAAVKISQVCLRCYRVFSQWGCAYHVPYHPPFHPLSLISNSPWALVVPSPHQIPLFNHYPYSLEEKCSQIQLTSVIEVSKLWPVGRIFFAAWLYKWSFIGTRLIHLLLCFSMALFMLP